jgi:hypothetical protein
MPFDKRTIAIAKAKADLASATAYEHVVTVCGPSTGHVTQTIIMCDTPERAKIVADALRWHASQSDDNTNSTSPVT